MKPKGRRIAITTGLVALVLLALTVYLGWPHLVLWYRFESLGMNMKGLPEYRHRKTGIVFVRLAGGSFFMGAQSSDPMGQNYDPDAKDRGKPIDDGPVHEVTLSPFMIGKYEVTQGQWRRVMGSDPSRFTGDVDRPVERVSWEDIQGFEAKTGFVLPSEAQWEYACRGGTTTPFAGTGKLDDMGWFSSNGAGVTHAVGQKAPNDFGIHDMHGNVWEWCEDNDEKGFYAKPDATKPNPVATAGSGARRIRGGSVNHLDWQCRSAIRGKGSPDGRLDTLGFRVSFYPVP
jgi:formylglycine-generating enzyme required for sulfatase activity